MSRRGSRHDVAIVGGGIVGAACALALAQQDLDVTLIESREPPAWSPGGRDLRVYAFAQDNAALLDQFDVWTRVIDSRAQAYRTMRVWDAAGGGELAFDADALGRRELGWIVEHGLLADVLWAALPRVGVTVLAPDTVTAFDQDDDGVLLRLERGTRVEARVAIAADGADSTLRRFAGVDVEAHDYAQRGVVAYLSTERPHQDTAWQRFLPGGPLAVLPFADGDSSIVWTLPDADAGAVLALDDDAFGNAVTRAFDARLGAMRPTSPRAAFALRRQLVRDCVHGRLLTIGDAAHVVHPLAGQGVNLGLRDVAALRDVVIGAQKRQADWASPGRLARWARTRRSENALAAYTFDGINRMFSSDGMHKTLLRGHALGAAGSLPWLGNALWRRASGG